MEGGSWTHFADMRRAYSDLSQAKKDQIEDVVIEHECVFSWPRLAIWNSR